MAGHDAAPRSGQELEAAVVALVERLGLTCQRQVRVGRRIWGAARRIDLVIWRDPARRLGIECKHQNDAGTAEEKIPAVIQDIQAWPIDGLVVFHGPGFSEHMRAFLISTGKAVLFEDLEIWLRLYFGLELA